MMPTMRWRRSRSGLLVPAASGADKTILNPQHANLVAFYQFEDTLGTDVTGAYPATFTGSWTQEAGRVGKAYRANDLNAYITIPALGTWFTGKSQFTVSFWDVVPTTTANTDFVFSISNTSHANPYYRFCIGIDNNAIAVSVNGYTGSSVVVYNWPEGTPTGRHHYAFRFNAGTLEIFFDGVLVASQSGLGSTIGSCYADARMGRIAHNTVNSSVNASAINRDQFRLFDFAVTNDQITALAEELDYDAAVLADSPFAYYVLNETSGTTANDSSGNARHGTYAGAVTKAQPWTMQGGSATAPSFDPVTDDSQITLPFTDNFTTGCTLECLTNLSSPQVDDIASLIGKIQYYASATNEFPISLRYNKSTGNLEFSLSKGDDYSADLTLTHPFSLQEPHHVAGVYRSNGNCELWVDKVKQAEATFTGTISTNTRAWLIGASHGYSGGVGQHRAKGLIGRAAIYNAALASERIEAHATAAGF